MDIIENKNSSLPISPRTYFAHIARYTEMIAETNITSTDKNLFCAVCGDISNGKHYGILACNGCSGFFKRSVRRKINYRCQLNSNMCIIDKAHRNQCQSCRFKKCLQMGMIKEAVQNERQSRTHHQYEDTGSLISILHPRSSKQTNIFMIKHHKYDLDDTTSSQILLMIIKWIHNLPTFLNLPIHDQFILIKQSWSELFLLLAIQYSISFDMFNHMFDIFKQLKIDPVEFECLKTIVLYRFDNQTLKEIKLIENLQDQALITLAQFQTPTRFGRLLLTLPLLANTPSKFIEKTFFSHISVSEFLVNIFKNK